MADLESLAGARHMSPMNLKYLWNSSIFSKPLPDDKNSYLSKSDSDANALAIFLNVDDHKITFRSC